MEAVEKSKKTALPRLIYALGIRGVGEHIARVLAEGFGDLKSLMEATEDELLATYEIGPETAASILDFFKERHNLSVINKLEKAGVVFETKKKAAKGGLAGKVFLFTGTLSGFARDEAKALVESMGGIAAASVNKKVDYVVAGLEAGSKLNKAKELGLKIITEEEFKKMAQAM